MVDLGWFDFFELAEPMWFWFMLFVSDTSKDHVGSWCRN